MALCCRTLTSTFLNCNGHDRDHSSTTTNYKTSKKAAHRSLSINMMSSSDSVSTMESYEEGNLERPKWSGETPLSRLVGALISFKPLYSVMKFGARQALISTAEKTNIPWREMTKEILESEVYKEMESVQNPNIVYPDCNFSSLESYYRGYNVDISIFEYNSGLVS